MRTGSPASEGPDQECSVIACVRRTYSRSWCEMHYRRWKRTGDVKGDRPPQGTVTRLCSVPDCVKPVDGRDLCHGHFQRVLRNGDVAAHDPLSRRKQPETCTVDGCDNETNAKGLCRAHRSRQVMHGDVLADVPIREFVGDGWISHGYKYVPVPPEFRYYSNGGTEIAEHRLVMAMYLGRPLTSSEVVHHKNGDRLDNDIENLELWSTTQPKGQRISDKVQYAVKILRRYRPELLVETGGRANWN
jgi:hypothetical protein